jgi:hypothetical protein
LRLGILSAALAVVACSSNRDPIVRRSVADTSFVSSPGDGLYRFSSDKPVNWTYHLVETLRIDASRLDIGQIDAAAFGPNRSIWIYDPKATDGETIRILDSLGRPIGTAGRSGEGPGEYRGPIRIFQLADGSMLVKEMFTVRAVRFAADGHALATIELPAVVASGWVVTPDTAGGWYITASFEEHTVKRVGRYGWLHFNNAGEVTDTAWPPKRMFEEPTPDGVAPGRIRTVGRDGSMLTTAPGQSRLLRIPQHGRVEAMEWRADPPKYGDEERRDMQAVDDKLSDLLKTPRTPLPARKAPASRILTDASGWTWVQLTAVADRIPDDELPKGPSDIPPIKWRDRDRWAAFARDGTMQFVVDAPPGAQILDRSSPYLLGVVSDANGAQSIVVWRVDVVGRPAD